MKANDRREALRRLGAMALASVAASAIPSRAVAAGTLRMPPPGAFRLTRKLVRPLVDGRSLLVEREWSFGFERAGSGMRAAAFAQRCTVDAPAALAPLARMEEARSDDGPFPALLDPAGQIVSASAAPRGASPEAIDSALAALRQAELRPQDHAQAQQFLTHLAGAAGAAVSAIPADLFFPVPGMQQDRRTIALPGGGEGLVEVHLCSTAQHASGLLDCIERTVSTRVGQDERTSSERWSLQQIRA